MSRVMHRIGLAAFAAAVMIGVWAGPASAETRREHFENCGGNGDYNEEQECCEEAGGQYESEFQGTHENGDPFFVDWCDLDGRDDEEMEQTTPETSSGNNTQSTSTTGTAEQPEQQTWTNNTQSTSTTGTAEQPQQEPSGSTYDSSYSYGSRWQSDSYEEDSSSDVEPAPRYSKYGFYD